MKKTSFCAIILFISVFFFILSFSVALIIMSRPIYYTQLENYNLEKLGPYSKEQIKEAYDDVLDYITFKEKSFSCGDLKFSASGADHFKDCKKLVALDFAVLLTSGITITILLLFKKRCNLYFKRLPAPFYSGISAIFLILLILLLSADGFTFAFIIFHKIFFIGKTNWYFDASTDEIINYMPESYFLNCAVAIGICIIILSAITIFLSFKIGKRK